MLSWLCVLAKPFGIHARRPCRGYITGAAALTKQGCLKSVAHSRYARTHNDSHTKPLHDATAQMAVNAQTQRHQRLTTRIGATPKARMLWLLAKSFARCKTSRASNAKHPFLTTIKVFRQTEYYVLVLGGYYINCSVCLLRFVAGLRNQAKYDKINSDIKQDLRII